MCDWTSCSSPFGESTRRVAAKHGDTVTAILKQNRAKPNSLCFWPEQKTVLDDKNSKYVTQTKHL